MSSSTLAPSAPRPAPAGPAGAYVKALGYIGLEVSSLADWRAFAAGVLGLGVSDAPGGLRLKMDARPYRFIVTEGPADDIVFAGWEVEDDAALDAYARHLDALGVPYMSGDADELTLRGVSRLLKVVDPNGLTHEAYVDSAVADAPFTPAVTKGGFLVGAGGLGHIVFGSRDYAGSVAFAQDVLGARLSDIIEQEVAPGVKAHVTFMHVNERHHSIAFAGRAGAKKLHHFMIEVERIEDVGLARDRHLASGLTVAQDIGQHSNDRMISYYGVTPSGFFVEYGWGGVKVDVESWTPGAYDRMSTWGHRPLGKPPGPPAAAAPPAAKPSPPAVAGAWTLFITTPMGEQKADLVLEGDLSGVITSMDAPAAVYGGAVQGDTLRFKADVTQPFPMTLAFDLTIEGDKVSGEVEAGPLGPTPVHGQRA